MNPIIQSLFDRKSCRIFEDKEISQEDKTLILQAAMQAPSAGNQQMYTIIENDFNFLCRLSKMV